VHDGVGGGLTQGGCDLLGLLKVAEDERHAGIDCLAMPFGKVVEHGHFMALVEHLLHADAADIAGPAGDENLHMLVMLG
jgi:hypothetical protein